MKIEKKLINHKLYKGKRPEKIKYIVVQNINNKHTSHYHVLNGNAIQVVPDEQMTDSVNGGRLNRNGYLHGICTKYNSVSIGLSDDLSEQDIETCLRLIMTLKQRYDVENDNIVRQMDITGEHNPKTWHDMNKWKKNIKDKLIDFSFAKTTKSE
jgi:hypothetical protein